MQPNLTTVFGTYRSWKLTDNTWIINFMDGSQNMYLLEGEEKALLVDTGWGAGNLRSYVETLTSKPVVVVNTHGHLDHSGGNGEWEQVWMLPGAKTDLSTLKDSPFDLTRLPFPRYEICPLADGQVMDLGGRPITFLDISAHSNGSVALLDPANGLLLVGDEIESSQTLLYDICVAEERPAFDLEQRLRQHHKNMLRLKGFQEQWKILLPAHNGAPIAPSYLDDYIGLAEHIFAGDAKIEDKLNHPHAEAGDPEHRLCRVRWKKASFFVVKEEMLRFYGKGL